MSANRISITQRVTHKMKRIPQPPLIPASMKPAGAAAGGGVAGLRVSVYGIANSAAWEAGQKSAREHGRVVWTLEDFDAAKAEFERMMGSMARGMKVDGQGRVQ